MSKITRIELEKRMENMNIKDITRNNYLSKIFFLHNTINPLAKDKQVIQMKFFKRHVEVIDFIKSKYDSLETRKSYIVAIIAMLRAMNKYEFVNKYEKDDEGKVINKLKPLGKVYKTELTKMFKSINNFHKTDEFKKQKNTISNDTIKSIEDENIMLWKHTKDLDYLQNLILLEVYFKTAPTRADYANLIIVDDIEKIDMNPSINYVDLKTKHFIFNRFKTAKYKGIVKISMVNEDTNYDSYSLIKELYDIRKINNDVVFLLIKKRAGTPMTPQELSKKFKRLTGISINDARKLYAKKHEGVLKKAKKISGGMMNSVNILNTHYLKNQ